MSTLTNHSRKYLTSSGYTENYFLKNLLDNNFANAVLSVNKQLFRKHEN